MYSIINPFVGDIVEKPSKTIITNNDLKSTVHPIIGYANEPLLSLNAACVPLTSIIHNLSVYVQMALNETPDVPPDGLTVDESAAIRLYTIEWQSPHQSLYLMLNSALKASDRENRQLYFKYLKLLLTALVKLPCVPQQTVWRGATKNLSAQFPPGTPVTWWSFLSCTSSLPVLENNLYLDNTCERTLFSIETINGRRVDGHSYYTDENEVVLLPGTHMQVQSQISPAPDLCIVHFKQVIPTEMLLEPPFEGISSISLNYSEVKLFYIQVQIYFRKRSKYNRIST